MDITSVAASGMLAGELRLSTGAANVANMQSDGAPGGASAGTAAYQPLRVDQSSLGAGGTTATTQAVTPSSSRGYDASASYADSSGMVAVPTVDPVTETSQQIYGLAQFQFSAKAVSAGDAMMQAVLDIRT
ncbi:flagellar basal body rod protein FlgC [Lichenicola sp.]|uniref:flagellar basal body rod protein FlgC n=1 Tax=Lichenicola sp. TaxID=2804529 RepID=UPI003AFFD2C6